MSKGYERLKENISDMISEEQAKLGYMKEAIRLYYPLSSLCNILEIKTDIKGMLNELSGFSDYVKEQLGEVEISHIKDRFCFLMSPKAAEYIHLNKKESDFIYKLIELAAAHDTTMQQIKDLFGKQKDECIIENINTEDFDVLIRFRNSKDKYYYCFKDEGAHIIYHRFLPQDYNDMFSEKKEG